MNKSVRRPSKPFAKTIFHGTRPGADGGVSEHPARLPYLPFSIDNNAAGYRCG